MVIYINYNRLQSAIQYQESVLIINVFSMAEIDQQYKKFIIIDMGENPVISHTIAPNP